MALYRSRTASPFLKRVLIPCWVVRISIIATELSLNGIIINYLAARTDVPGFTPLLIKFSALEAVLGACAVLDIVCIAKLAQKTLTPLILFALNLSETTIFIILFCICLASPFNSLDVILNSFILLACLVLLGYSSFVFHKHRRGTLPGSYERTADFPESLNLVAPTDSRLGQTEAHVKASEVTQPRAMAFPTAYESRAEAYEPYRPS